MEPKMEVEAPEPADTQPEDIPEVRGGQLLPFWVLMLLQGEFSGEIHLQAGLVQGGGIKGIFPEGEEDQVGL